MPHGQDKHGVLRLFVAIQGQIAGLTAGNHQLPQSLLDRTAYEWMVCEDSNRFRDQPHRFRGGQRMLLAKKIREPFKISERAPRIDYARQDFALGLDGVLPCARSSKYAFTSAAA